jgi:hypothetical protein
MTRCPFSPAARGLAAEGRIIPTILLFMSNFINLSQESMPQFFFRFDRPFFGPKAGLKPESFNRIAPPIDQPYSHTP